MGGVVGHCVRGGDGRERNEKPDDDGGGHGELKKKWKAFLRSSLFTLFSFDRDAQQIGSQAQVAMKLRGTMGGVVEHCMHGGDGRERNEKPDDDRGGHGELKKKWKAFLRYSLFPLFSFDRDAQQTGSQAQVAMKLRGKSKHRNIHFIENGGNLSKELISSTHGKINPFRMFSLKELQKATDNFSPNMIISQGMSVVYKGIHDGQLLAFKSYRQHIVEHDMFINEMVSLSQANHRNIHKLIGCCIETKFPMLVSELFPNGSLHERLTKADASNQLQWARRLRIAIEVADAVAYLHTALRLPITHGLISSRSILLDEFSGKLCTFMFSEMQKDPAYCDQNIGRDIHGFGMLLVELTVGKALFLNYDHTWDDILRIAAKNIEKEDMPKAKANACLELAMRCIASNNEGKRPSMKQIVRELRKISKSDASGSE